MSQASTNHQDKLEKIEAQVSKLTFLHQELETKLRYAKELEALEREKLRLEVMNEILRRLPPPQP